MSPKISEEAKEQRKIAILEAAERCFNRKGYYETSIDDIVHESLMSKGAIYTYFDSKEEIFISLMNYITQQSFAAVDEKLAQFATASEKLRYLISRNYLLYESAQNMQRVHYEFWLYAASSPVLKEMMERRKKLFDSVIENIIKEGIEQGEFRKNIDTEMVAAMYWHFRDGIWLHQLTTGDPVQFEKYIRLFEEMYFKYLTQD